MTVIEQVTTASCSTDIIIHWMHNISRSAVSVLGWFRLRLNTSLSIWRFSIT